MFNLLTFLKSLIDLSLIDQVTQKTAGSDVFVVLLVTLLVWGGLFFYLFSLDRKVKMLENKIALSQESELVEE